MATLPFALSISHLVSSVGADVGFAAILGLALLALLFFSQARETATLRRRADEAEEHLRHLAAYVEQLSSTRTPGPAAHGSSTAAVAVAPAPAAARVAGRQASDPSATRTASPAAGRAGARAGDVAMIPAAPAGVAAPALSAATRLIPLAEPDSISIRALKNGDSETAAVPETAHVGASAPAATLVPVAAAPPQAPTGPPPSTAAGSANGARRGSTVPLVTSDDPPPRAPSQSQGASASRPVGPPPFRDPVPDQGPQLRRFGVIAAAVVAVVVAVVAVLVLINRNNGNSQSAASAASPRVGSGSARAHRHAVVTITPSSVTVAVLNGTSTSNLAADVMAKLTSTGFKGGTKSNAPVSTLRSTIVGYTQPSFRADALAVASSLKLSRASVQGVAPADRSVACQGATTGCAAQVVVTVGSDLARIASTASSASTA